MYLRSFVLPYLGTEAVTHRQQHWQPKLSIPDVPTTQEKDGKIVEARFCLQ